MADDWYKGFWRSGALPLGLILVMLARVFLLVWLDPK